MLGLRGLGDLNCPGDPGCPGYVAPGSTDYQTSLLQEILSNQAGGWTSPGGLPVAASSSTGTFTAWLNTNATTVAIAAAVGIAVVILAKAGR